MTEQYRKFVPGVLTAGYLVFYLVVLLNNTIWSVGDQTDVIRTGAAAFPIGLLLSFMYPGTRDGAFAAISICAVLNAVVIYLVSRWHVR